MGLLYLRCILREKKSISLELPDCIVYITLFGSYPNWFLIKKNKRHLLHMKRGWELILCHLEKKNLYMLLTKAYAGVLSLNQPMHCQYFLEVSRDDFYSFFSSSSEDEHQFREVPTTLLSSLNLHMAPEFCSHLAMLCLSRSFSLVLWQTHCMYVKYITLTQNSSTAYPPRGTSEFNCQLTTTAKPGKNAFTTFTVPVPEKV